LNSELKREASRKEEKEEEIEREGDEGRREEWNWIGYGKK